MSGLFQWSRTVSSLHDEGPNITSLEPLYGTTNWTHYARTNSLQEELDAR